MRLQVEPIPAFQDNYIWMIRLPGDARRVLVVDPGDAAPVDARLAEDGLSLAGILVTHHHSDHVGGVLRLVERWQCPVWGPAREDIPCRDHALSGGDRIEVEGLAFDILDVRGHTAGHIAYSGHGALFIGDTLFAAGCGRLFEGTPAEMQASLAPLRALAPDTRIYCGHEYTLANLRFAHAVEPDNLAITAREAAARAVREAGRPTLPTRLSDELATNPFLRWDAPGVIASASAWAGRPLRNTVEVFATVRRWKDGF